MPFRKFRNVTEYTEEKGWVTTRRAERPPGEKPLMTNDELEKFQENYSYEWNVRKMSMEARIDSWLTVDSWLPGNRTRSRSRSSSEEQEPAPVQQLTAQQPSMPPPVHLRTGMISQDKGKGNYYTRSDSK